MKWSEYFIPTLKEDPKEAEVPSHKLMLRAGLIRKLAAGIYSYLPLGLRVLVNIENVIRKAMNKQGAIEVFLPALHPLEIWKKSARDKTLIADIGISFKDRHGNSFVLGPTHEEIITDLVAREVKSYRQLPLILYQIQTKFRDEPRPRFGVVRSKEFIMKDAYSFNKDDKGLNKSYNDMHEAYCEIMDRCNLSYIVVEADPGMMGGKESAEFMILTESGEDMIAHCPKCSYAVSLKAGVGSCSCPKCGKEAEIKRAMEIGHIFKLGTKYSEDLGANFLDKDGKEKPIIMGCYGIGVNRLLAAVIELNHDNKGIIWPIAISPYQVLILPIDKNSESFKIAEKIYQDLKSENLDILLDDRDIQAGAKFKDADLIGIPYQIIIGPKSLKEGKVELRHRKDNKKELVDKSKIIDYIKRGL